MEHVLLAIDCYCDTGILQLGYNSFSITRGECYEINFLRPGIFQLFQDCEYTR